MPFLYLSTKRFHWKYQSYKCGIFEVFTGHCSVIKMDKNSVEHFELYSRRHSSRDVPSTRDATDAQNKRYSLSTDENNSASISIISENHPSVPRVSLMRSRSEQNKSTDQSDSILKGINLRNRNTLTSSFLRRKRMEYAGRH